MTRSCWSSGNEQYQHPLLLNALSRRRSGGQHVLPNYARLATRRLQTNPLVEGQTVRLRIHHLQHFLRDEYGASRLAVQLIPLCCALSLE